MASSKADGESLGPGQRPEHPAFLGFQQEDRKERDDDDQKREEKRRSYLLGRIQKDSLSFAGRDAALLRFIASARVLRFGQMPVAIFHHHDRRVHQNPDGQRQSAERHNVRTDFQVVHWNERCDDGDRQGQDRNEGGAEVKEEDDDHEADDDRFLDQVAIEGADRVLDQPGSIVTGDDFHAGRQRSGNLRELLLDAGDHIQRVRAVAHHHNAAGGFALAVPLRHAAPHIRAERYRSEVADQDRRPILAGDRNRFQIRERPQIAQAPDHVFGASELKQPPAHLVRAVADLFDHRRERDVKGAELVRVQPDLVLPDKAADARDFRNPWNRLDLIP